MNTEPKTTTGKNEQKVTEKEIQSLLNFKCIQFYLQLNKNSSNFHYQARKKKKRKKQNLEI